MEITITTLLIAGYPNALELTQIFINAFGIFGRGNNTETHFSLSTAVFPCQHHVTGALYYYSSS